MSARWFNRGCTLMRIQVWDGLSGARITFSAAELPSKSIRQLSRLTENVNLQRGLLRHLSQFPEVQLLDNVKVQSIVRENREENAWPLVHLSDGRVIRARLLVSLRIRLLILLLQPRRSVQMATTLPSGRTRVYGAMAGPMTRRVSSVQSSTSHGHRSRARTLSLTNASCLPVPLPSCRCLRRRRHSYGRRNRTWPRC